MECSNDKMNGIAFAFEIEIESGFQIEFEFMNEDLDPCNFKNSNLRLQNESVSGYGK